MNRYTAHEFDNRDSSQMYEYLEARIEVMKRRITGAPIPSRCGDFKPPL